jgi:glycerate 2-kinase
VKVLIAPDKFKGSLSSLEAAEAIARGWRRAWPECELDLVPIADGGEGFASALLMGLGGEWITAPAHDALGRPIEARYAWVPERRLAIIEMSEASGLWRLQSEERDPLRANTFGTGELLHDAITRGAEEVLIGLGGSATTDAGTGLARALGHEFLDAEDRPLPDLPGSLSQLARISPPAQRGSPRVVAACDVENPLLGPRGTAHVFAPQKGATPEHVAFLEGALGQLADVVQRDLGCDFRLTPGAGAAGGLGYGLLTFAGASIRSGFEMVSEVLDLPRRLRACDLVLTGEGRLDDQTLDGKGPAGLARLARELDRPVIAFGGSIAEGAGLERLFDALCPIVSRPLSLTEAMAQGADLLESAAGQVATLMRLSTLRLATSATHANL